MRKVVSDGKKRNKKISLVSQEKYLETADLCAAKKSLLQQQKRKLLRNRYPIGWIQIKQIV